MKDSIISVLEGALLSKGEGEKTIKVKELRKLVFLSLQKDENEKSSKKEYKKAIQTLEKEGQLNLDSDGLISMKSGKKDKKKSKKRKRKEEENEESSKKHNKQDSTTEPEDHKGDDDDGEDAEEEQEASPSNDKAKNTPCKGNPQGVTRLFVGNLPFAVDETSLKTFMPGVTHIKWITDKETGKFYGSAFVEMETSSHAADAVAKAGSQLMGRQIKINFAPARPGDVWPPPNNKRTTTGGAEGGGGQAGGSGVKAMSAKPDDCRKLFIGNLSYEIDDDAITKFFASVDAEIKAVRWLHHKDSGDFKGCGFVEFWKPEVRSQS
mmetsp:Transcript_40847/g.85015  ORF Transcript_40847/g.85015 Transcript_40847/m.85015 type:complete len:322 (+) Transcript_40847:78-1043(+)